MTTIASLRRVLCDSVSYEYQRKPRRATDFASLKRPVILAIGAMTVISACTSTAISNAQSPQAKSITVEESVDTATVPDTSDSKSSAAPTPAPTQATTAPETSTTSEAAPTTVVDTTTTTLVESLDVFDADCVVEVAAGESLETIAAQYDGSVSAFGLWAENDFIEVVEQKDLVDVCVDNRINDITGETQIGIDDPAVSAALVANVERQQTKLNAMFADYRTGDLSVDGDSGPLTGQRLCAARLALGLPTTTADMMPGTDEQNALMAAENLPTPGSTSTESERWILIDRTCQMMFIGSGPDTIFVFPTSTGSEGFETRDQDRARAFRFNPAVDNGGWHNSTDYPVGVDNPLNGNLWKPLYFDLGQAIHGANNVPPTPQSKGCARLRLGDQEALLGWLGLINLQSETWQASQLNVTVNVQGEFQPRA